MKLTRVLAGFILIWIVFDRAAGMLGGIRGEAGVLVCALVVGTALAVEVFIFKRTLRQAGRTIKPLRNESAICPVVQFLDIDFPWFNIE